jgi:hypothetical protein
MSPILTAQVSVLDFLHAEGDIATFVYKGNDLENDNPSNHPRRIEITRQVWEDLGKPENITVTIQPGDQSTGHTEEDDNGNT